MSVTRRQRPARDERGAVAILVALTITLLLVVAGLVLDFGLVRVDKQAVKSATDSAATAGVAAGDKGTGQIHTFHAVCGALSYLKATNRLASLPDSICSSANLASKTAVMCDPASATTHATYDQTITSAGATYRVVIKSPYVLTSDGWTEESVTNLANDQSTVSGCDQVGVQVFEARTPGLGSLAGAGDLQFKVRSVARALLGGNDALSPALILLERKLCSTITVGSAGGGSGTFIRVNGIGSTPGSIHVDTDATGSDCGSGSGQQALQGKQADGVVAYGSVSPTGVAGVISAYAANLGVAPTTVYDSLSNVYGTPSTSGTGAVKVPVAGRDQVTRSVVDVRYRAPVRAAIAGASSVWDNPSGWRVVGCNPTPSDLAATTPLWINCTSNSGITLSGTIRASQIYFNGFFKGGNLEMPNALSVYVSNTVSSAPINSSAISLSNGNGFCVRATCSTASTAKCSTSAATGRARLFIRRGNLDATGGLLRLCNTTSFMLGGDRLSGCVPTSDGAAPSSTPCTTSPTTGNSIIGVAGTAGLDWTAPNQYADTIPPSDSAAAWGNFEDLAVWSESAGAYKFAGGAGMSTRGVFMVPNAFPVQVGGGSSQTLFNAQFIARTFAVSGGGTLSLTTDPKNAVTVPSILSNVLIR